MKQINLEEQKKLLVGILDYIDSFCKGKGIDYFLLGGTLIGAIRHKGFIPWDDDIDICMLRKDYDHFIHSFSDQSGRYKIVAFERDNSWYLPTAKVIDTHTFLSEGVPGKDPIGLFVDIFPIDNCPGDFEESCRFANSLQIYRQLLTYKNLGVSSDRGIVKNTALRIIHFILAPISRKSLIKVITRKASKYKNNHCKYVGELTNMPYGCREIYKVDWFCGTIELEFEGKRYLAPVGYHDILSTCFGNYMMLPPVDKQVSHHKNIAFWRNEF